MVVRITGSSLEYPGRNLGAAGVSPPGSPQGFKPNLCLPLPECRTVPSKQLFFFLKKDMPKDKLCHFYQSWANTLASVKQTHFPFNSL